MTASSLPANPEDRNALFAQACTRIASGEAMSEVAISIGLSPQVLSRWLLSKVPDKYREAQEAGIVAKVAEQGEKLETAQNHVEVARARETARFWQWVAERLLPRFAAKQEIGAPGEFQAFDEREVARRYAYIKGVARRVVDAEIVSSAATT